MTDQEKQERKALFQAATRYAKQQYKAYQRHLSGVMTAGESWGAIRDYTRLSNEADARLLDWLNAINRVDKEGGGPEELERVHELYAFDLGPAPAVAGAPSVDWDNRRPPTPPTVWEQHPLEPDESIVMNVRRNAFWYVAPWVWVLFMGGVDTIVGGLFFTLGAVITWWWIKQYRYLITDKRIIARVGVFNKEAIIIRLDRVQDVIVHRPVWAQLFRNGRVTIATAGGPTRELVIPNQEDPDKVANAIRGGYNR